MSDAFYLPHGDGRFTSTEHTSGPWDDRLQHGGPPTALLIRALEALPGLSGNIVRISIDLLGPVPLGEITVTARTIRAGRNVELLQAELSADGRTAVRATAWRILTRKLPLPGPTIDESIIAVPPLPDADSPLPAWPGGFLKAMHWRVVSGDWLELGPATVWAKMRIPLVPDETPSAMQRVAVLADCGNGASASLPLTDWVFINPDLTLHLLRPPVGEWFCLDAATSIDATGFGLARSVLFDMTGPVARGAQSLFVSDR